MQRQEYGKSLHYKYNKINKNSKSQVFLTDIFISFIFLLIVFGLLYSFKLVDYSTNEVNSVNSNIMNSFFNTQINDLNDQYVVSLFQQGKIRNIKLSVSQQIAFFYYDNEINISKNLTGIFASSVVPRKINIEIFLNGISLYNKTNNIDFESSTTSSQKSRSVYGFYNTTDTFGPYDFVVRTWQ